MKKIYTKIPAIIAMLITVASFALLVVGFAVSKNEIEPESGVSRAFALAILGLLTALCSLVLYFIDAILSIIKACKKIDTVFNSILATVIFATIPVVSATRVLPDIAIAVWVAIIFVLELISVIRDIIMNERR